MVEDDPAVGRKIHVELKHRYADRDGVPEGGERVLGSKGSSTTVGDHGRVSGEERGGGEGYEDRHGVEVSMGVGVI